MHKLRILQQAWEPAWAHLNSGPGEHFVFFLARHYATREGPVLVADEVLRVCPRGGHLRGPRMGRVRRCSHARH